MKKTKLSHQILTSTIAILASVLLSAFISIGMNSYREAKTEELLQLNGLINKNTEFQKELHLLSFKSESVSEYVSAGELDVSANALLLNAKQALQTLTADLADFGVDKEIAVITGEFDGLKGDLQNLVKANLNVEEIKLLSAYSVGNLLVSSQNVKDQLRTLDGIPLDLKAIKLEKYVGSISKHFLNFVLVGDEKAEKKLVAELSEYNGILDKINGAIKATKASRSQKKLIKFARRDRDIVYTTFTQSKSSNLRKEETKSEILGRFAKIETALAGIASQLINQEKEFRAEAENLAFVSNIVLIIVTGIVIFCLYLLARRLESKVTKPIKRVADHFEKISKNDQTVEKLPPSAETLEIYNLERMVLEYHESDEASRLAEKRLVEQQREESKQNRHSKTNELIENGRREITQALEEIRDRSKDVGQEVTKMGDASSDVLAKLTNASITSDSALGRAKSIEATTKELLNDASIARKEMAKTAQIVSSADSDAKKATKRITALHEATEKVSDIVGMISDIANQTNLLALNATIEAARAGEVGKGFAVVANEVKSLANQTSSATGEISQKIDEIRYLTDEAVEEVSTIANTISDANSATNTVNNIIGDQAAATNNIAENVQTILQTTDDVLENIRQIVGLAEQTNLTASRLSESTSKQYQESDIVAQRVEKFFESVSGL